MFIAIGYWYGQYIVSSLQRKWW